MWPTGSTYTGWYCTLGYDFNDWIKFHSETEVEHAFVSNESKDGELSVEQAYVDFLLSRLRQCARRPLSCALWE